MKIAVVLGTRPEIIKMSPVIRALGKRNAHYFNFLQLEKNARLILSDSGGVQEES